MHAYLKWCLSHKHFQMFDGLLGGGDKTINGNENDSGNEV